MLLSNKMDRIQKMFGQLDSDIKALVKGAIELSWFSRGGWSYETIMNMSAGERDLASDFIKNRLESQAKSPFPIY